MNKTQSNDDEITISHLKKIVDKFVSERDWEKYHTPKNLAESISIEAAELLELFQWRNDREIEMFLEDPKFVSEIEEELADILIYCISFANRLNIDISRAISSKMEKNKRKYPIDLYKGKLGKPK
ncbi:MAG: nucleotide pyrophosphohydrolase [Candidatus Odinarchaeota archaeon]|nr:nucleotide pyrophosphohydrolase [Candidatus Odinarchaeota archaeon]